MAWKEFYIKKKSGGERHIISPDEEIKVEQKEILNELYKIYYPFNEFYYAYGGLPFKSIKKSAENHLRAKVVINFDIKDFFNNINKKILLEILKKDFDEKEVRNAEDILGRIEKYCFYKNMVPQGAITSPFLSNIYLKEFDRIMSAVAHRGYFNYSRYFDDLTFSSNIKKKIIDSIDETIQKELKAGQIIRIVNHYLEKLNLKLNYEKTDVMSKGRRQNVCNITVNEKVNINKKYYKWLRAIKHHFENNLETTITKQQYNGHLAFVKSINEEVANKLTIK